MVVKSLFLRGIFFGIREFTGMILDNYGFHVYF